MLKIALEYGIKNAVQQILQKCYMTSDQLTQIEFIANSELEVGSIQFLNPLLLCESWVLKIVQKQVLIGRRLPNVTKLSNLNEVTQIDLKIAQVIKKKLMCVKGYTRPQQYVKTFYLI